MTLKIHEHDSDIDIIHKYNSFELKSWINQLAYIETEIDNLLKLCNKATSNHILINELSPLFSKLKSQNNNLYNLIFSYSKAYINVAECNDIQCDMVYLNEYERFRKNYQSHLNSYQKLKDDLYSRTLQCI